MKPVDINDMIGRERLAEEISDKWHQWDQARATWKEEKKELRNYIFATDTRKTTNAKLRTIRRARHSAGSVTGVTISEFLALPARAQLTVSYDVDEKAQGFLSLRKL